MSKGKPTGNKLIQSEADVRELVLSGLRKICNPVVETIGPLGKNVLYEDSMGNFVLTNDGVTIAREINVENPIENAVVEMVKEGARRTNQEAGDATSTTILYTKTLVERVYALKKKGYTQKQIRDMFESVSAKLLKRLTKMKKEVTDDATLEEVAKISANNDGEIAKIVADTIKTAGLDGMVFLDFSGDDKTVLDKQTGFKTPGGMIYQNLYPDLGRPAVTYKDMHVIIFDKQLYYADEAEHILRFAVDMGIKKLCIVARNFVGDAPNTFIANYAKGIIQVVLAKIDDTTQLGDLAAYLGTEIISEEAGRRVDSISYLDFVEAESVYADPQKVLLKHKTESPTLKKRIASIKDDLKKDKENGTLKDRLASLTNGIVYLKVGGRTQAEAREKLFRYEDAISAVRSAKRTGYMIGGGLSIYNAFNAKDYSTSEERETARILSQASLERLAENSNADLDYSQLTDSVGLNALTGKYEDLLKAGVVEPFRAVELAIQNAVSVATIITSIGTFITTEYDKGTDKN